jgi:hypothetical protein
VFVGIVLCVLAALFVYARPGWNGGPTMTARTPQVWKASSTLLLTQEGFPSGRAVDKGNANDQSRLSNLAVLYSELAVSDRVRAYAEAHGKLHGDITAEPVIYTIGQFATPVVLPMVRVSTTAPTAAEALRGSTQVANALQRYVTSGQAAAKIRPTDRVVIQTARSGRLPGSQPFLVSGPSKAVPIVVFALLTGLLLMAVFAYDNYRVHASDVSRASVDSAAARGAPRLQPTAAAPVDRPQAEGGKGRVPRRPTAVLSSESPHPEARVADVPAVPRRRSR